MTGVQELSDMKEDLNKMKPISGQVFASMIGVINQERIDQCSETYRVRSCSNSSLLREGLGGTKALLYDVIISHRRLSGGYPSSCSMCLLNPSLFYYTASCCVRDYVSSIRVNPSGEKCYNGESLRSFDPPYTPFFHYEGGCYLSDRRLGPGGHQLIELKTWKGNIDHA